MDNPLDCWMIFLAEPEKLINMQKFDISVYPNLMKAVEILDRSNFTLEQQIAYDNHLFAVADINQSNIDSFDRGHEEGEQTGLQKGLSLSRAIIKELKEGELSHQEIAGKFSISIAYVQLLAEDLSS